MLREPGSGRGRRPPSGSSTVFLRKFLSVLILLWVAFGLAACGGFLPKSDNNRHNQPLSSGTVNALKAMGSSPGEAMVIRIFKEEKTLEVWKRTASGEFRKFRDYEICAYSGDLGPSSRKATVKAPRASTPSRPG
ncbi:hypothetical protein ACFSX5_19350 [Devosia albogilva]|uniref:Lipoprotein SmpA/OmlA domain-containing protein n=1 Tax=Devosia albogilva TaxID=429726 RepID=A0ABW5QR09_9HYPH